MKLLSGMALVALLFTGCVESPKPIGNTLIDPNNVFAIADTTVTSASDTTFKRPPVNGYGSSDLVGILNSTESSVALFDFVPASLDSLLIATIDTAEIRLTVKYRLRPASYPITFEVREVTQPWSEGSITADSLTPSTVGSSVFGTFSDSMNSGQIVTARLDSNSVRRWINSHADTNNTPFYGFAVQAAPGGATGIIGFATFSELVSSPPALVVKYTTVNGTHDSVAFISGFDTYLASTTDNVFSHFEVQGGFGIQSKLQFDVSAFVSHVTVNKAVMTLFVDSSESIKGGYSPDSVVAFLGVEDTISNDYSSTIFTYGLYGVTSDGIGKYEFNLTNLVQRWINGVNPNNGLILGWAAQSSAAEKLVFGRSNDSDAARRPTLKITYSSRTK